MSSDDPQNIPRARNGRAPDVFEPGGGVPMRCHGDSDWTSDGDYTSNSYVYDFAQLVDTLGYEQVTIVGH